MNPCIWVIIFLYLGITLRSSQKILGLEDKGKQSLQISGTAHQATQNLNPKILNTPQPSYENLKTCNIKVFSIIVLCYVYSV